METSNDVMHVIVETGMSSWLKGIQTQNQKQQHCQNPTLCPTKSCLLRVEALS